MPHLKIYLLGAPRVELDGTAIALPRRKIMAIFTYLARTRQAHRRDALATLFWPESNQSSARGALRRELHLLNQTIGEAWFTINRETIALNADAPIWIDVEEFSRLIADKAAAAAVALYQGDFLAGFTLADCPDFGNWQCFEADSLRRDYAGALEALVRQHTQQNEFEPAIDYARQWLALDTMHEPVHRELMRLFALAGQPAAALRQYEECVRILDDELGVAPTDETTTLFAAIRARRFPEVRETAEGGRKESVKGKSSIPTPTASPSPSSPSPDARRHNLPTQATSFLGREEEVAAIRQLLLVQSECRLLTLLGPGGIGKTRLSLQVAQSLVEDTHTGLQDGIYFVPLASLTDEADLVGAIANAVGCAFRGSDEPQTQLANFLRPQKLLLLVDNFEHLLDGAQLLSVLLEAAPELLLLTTSREALDLPEEWLYPLGGLTPPAADAPQAEIEANAAVQLFVQRARRADATFTLTLESAKQVVRICRLVDGMPLGLELAAAWLHTLTVEELADEIASNLDILASELRNIPERHRSLRAVFEQTWQRLRPAERQTLCRLAIFRGAFTREAAAAVAQASLVDISALVERSLCRYQAGRYDIHELLRQFALARLDDAEERVIRAQHSDYFGTLVGTQQAHLVSATEEQALQLVADEYDNILAAWRHDVDQLASGRDIVRWAGQMRALVPMLAAYFDRRALFWEGERIFQQALLALESMAIEAIEDEPLFQELVLSLQIEQAGMGMHLGRYQPAKLVLSALLPKLRAPIKHPQLSTALVYLTLAHIRMGEFDQADLYNDEAIALCQGPSLQRDRAAALINRGVAAGHRSQYGVARRAFQEAGQIFEALGYGTGHARCINNIGSTYIGGEDDIVAAIGYYERAHQIASHHNSRLWSGVTLTNLGYCAYELGAYDDASTKYREGLAIFRELRDMRWVTVTLADISYALIAQGALANATQYLREALGYVQQYQLIADGLKALAATALVLEQQQAHALAVALATHVLDDARTRSTAEKHCRHLLATLAETMSESAYAAAQFHGRSTPYDLMVTSALESLERLG